MMSEAKRVGRGGARVSSIHIGDIGTGIVLSWEDSLIERLPMSPACYQEREEQAETLAEFWKAEGVRQERERILSLPELAQEAYRAEYGMEHLMRIDGKNALREQLKRAINTEDK